MFSSEVTLERGHTSVVPVRETLGPKAGLMGTAGVTLEEGLSVR